jgi:hypothetical protein
MFRVENRYPGYSQEKTTLVSVRLRISLFALIFTNKGLQEMTLELSTTTRNSSTLLKKAWVIYTPQRRKLAVS